MNEEEAIVYFKNYIKVKKEVIKERQNEWLNADSRYTQQLEKMAEVFETFLNLLEKKDKEILELKKENRELGNQINRLTDEFHKIYPPMTSN